MRVFFASLMIVVMCGFFLFLTGCSKTSEDKFSSCDTTKVSYAAGIVPILQNFCYSCHGNGNTAGSGGYLLEGYANLRKFADNGFLVGNVTHAPRYVGMPFGQPKLPDCEVNTIVAWVHQGALNN